MSKPWEQDPIIDDSTSVASEETPTLPDKTVLSGSKPWEQDPIVDDVVGADDLVRAGAGGFNRGLTELVGAPVDIVNSLMRKLGLPISETPAGGSKSLQNLVGEQFFPEAPDTTAGRVIERTGEEIGASVLPSAAIFKAARGIRPLVTRPSALSYVKRAILDPITKAPGAVASGELLATGGAGVGAGIAQELAPDSQAAETAGQLVGGTAPVVLANTPTAIVTRVVRGLTSRFNKAGRDAAAKDFVGKLLGEHLTPDKIQNLNTSREIQQKFRDVGVDPPEFSLGQSTGSPALLRQQKQIELAASGPELEEIAARNIRNEQAIKAYTRRVTPPGPEEDIDTIIDTASGNVQSFSHEMDGLANRLLLEEKGLAQGLKPINRIYTGKSMRDGIQQARRQRSNEMSLLADELGINSADISVDYNTWRDGIINKFKPASRFETASDTPAIFKQIVNDNPELSTTFQDIKALRENISDDLLDEMSSPFSSRRKIRFLTLLKKDVDSFIDNIPGDIGVKAKEFRKTYLEEYIKPFEQGGIYKSKTKDGTGLFKTNDEQVASIFLDNESAARQYRQNFGNDPIMMGHLENSMLDDLRHKTVDVGTDFINQKKLKTWIKKNERVLNELPEINDKITNIQQLQDGIIGRQAQLAQRRMSIEDKTMAKRLTKFGQGDLTGDQILNEVLVNPKKMDDFLFFLGKDPDMKSALARIIWDRATQGSSVDTIKFLNSHSKSLSKIFTKKHLKNIEDITWAKVGAERAPNTEGSAALFSPGAAFEELVGQGIPQLSSRLFAFQTGRVQKGYLATDTVLRGLRGRAALDADRIFKEILYDPKIAKEMAQSVDNLGKPQKESLLTKTGRKLLPLRGRAFALGLPYIEREEQ